MSEFIRALLSDRLNPTIPEKDDFFGPLIGEWDFKRKSLESDGKYHNTVGEWLFSRILEGKLIQDIFIWPPRNQREESMEEGEYGTTVRTYDSNNHSWNIVYCSGGFVGQFVAVREGKRIVQTSKNDPNVQWVFSDITENSFHWCDQRLEADGTWKVYEELELTRKKS